MEEEREEEEGRFAHFWTTRKLSEVQWKNPMFSSSPPPRGQGPPPNLPLVFIENSRITNFVSPGPTLEVWPQY